jgi:hypothetical protein
LSEWLHSDGAIVSGDSGAHQYALLRILGSR